MAERETQKLRERERETHTETERDREREKEGRETRRAQDLLPSLVCKARFRLPEPELQSLSLNGLSKRSNALFNVQLKKNYSTELDLLVELE